MQFGIGKALAAALSIAVLTGATAASALIEEKRFQDKTKAEIERLEIAEDDVESVKIVVLRRKSDRGPEIRGAEGWVRLSFCSGYLVVAMNRVAYALDIYTKGDCSIAGVKNR